MDSQMDIEIDIDRERLGVKRLSEWEGERYLHNFGKIRSFGHTVQGSFEKCPWVFASATQRPFQNKDRKCRAQLCPTYARGNTYPQEQRLGKSLSERARWHNCDTSAATTRRLSLTGCASGRRPFWSGRLSGKLSGRLGKERMPGAATGWRVLVPTAEETWRVMFN